MNPLLDTDRIDDTPEAFLARIGGIRRRWGFPEQDSGNVSWLVDAAGGRYFVKSAGEPDTGCLLSHPERVALLRNAIALHRAVDHAALPRLRNVIESPLGPLLVRDGAEGDLVREALARFRARPGAEITAALSAVYDLHPAIAAAGWIASDFYDGGLVYDFAARRIHVIDLDHYRRGPFTNDMGRMFGSTRFMAPEEHRRGARIDERTTVYTLGRAAAVLLSDGTLERAPFRGSDGAFQAMGRACRVRREERYGSVAEFVAEWSSVSS